MQVVSGLNDSFATTVNGDLRACGGAEDIAGDGAGEASYISGLDLASEEVLGLILLDRHVVAFGGSSESLWGPEVCVEDGIWVEDIDTDLMLTEL